MGQSKTSAEVADEKIAELRAVIREANQMLTDYKAALREGREFLVKDIRVEVDEKFGAVAKENIDNWSAHVKEAMAASVAKVETEFDSLRDMLMGEDKHARKMGMTSIPDLIKQKVENEAPPNS